MRKQNFVKIKNVNIAKWRNFKEEKTTTFLNKNPWHKPLFSRSFLSRTFFINYNRTLSNMPSLSAAHTLLQYWDSRFIRITWALWIIQLVFEFIVIQLMYFFSNSWKFMRFGIHNHGNSWVYKFTFIEVHGFSNSYS